MKVSAVALVALVAVVIPLVVQHGQAAVNCGQVDAALIPCIGYLMGQGGDSPSPSCCAGVRAVKELAQTTADKRALCSCVKAAAGRSAGLKDGAAQSLPAKCGVQLSIPVSRTFNCDTIN
ncbi:hypothetical protein ABFX02_02G143100 [Erythranthe guttata]